MKLKRTAVLFLTYLVGIIILAGCQQAVQPEKEMSKGIRIGSLIKVRPDFEERYIILHKHTFPDVLAQIRRSNIRNYSIFLKDGILFSYLEYIGDDYKTDMDKIAEDATTREWWKLTDPMQEPLETQKEGEWWAAIEVVFHMGEIKKPYTDVKRFASVIDLKPEFEEEYKKLHADIWLSVLEQIQKSNIQNYSIFLHEGRLYSYFEYVGDDYDADMEKMASDPETQRWWDVCKPMQKKVPTAKEDEWWSELIEVFHTD